MRDGSRTKARIEAEALRLFAENGVDATSIRDIASAAGVAEGALYRHFRSKDEMARDIFLRGYADLAKEVNRVAAGSRPFAGTVAEVVAIFCRLFDQDRARFAFLLLSQHRFLREVPAGADVNVVDAVAAIFEGAIRRREIPDQEADLVAAMALGIVAQPAVFTIYGRLRGALSDRVPELSDAVIASAHLPRLHRKAGSA